MLLHPALVESGSMSQFKFVYSLSFCCCFGQALPEASHDVIEEVVNGETFRSLRFETEEDLFYRVEQTSDLQTWTEIFSIDGLGGPVIIPMVQTSGQSPQQGANSLEQEGVTIHLNPTTSNGTLVSWRSLDLGYLVQHHLPSIDLDQTWNTAPLVNYLTADYYMGVVRSSNPVNAPATALPPLLTEDSDLISQFVSEYSNIANGIGGTGTIGVPIANASFFRIRVSEADIDRDGIPDRIERLPLPNGTDTDRFNPDTDGDGYWDGAEAAQDKDPKDPNDYPDPQTRPSTNLPGSGGPLVAPLQFDPVEVGFHEKNHVLQSDNGKTNYVSPQWRAESHNYPVSYKRGEEITLSGKFKLPYYITGAFVQVSGPNGISFPGPVALLSIGDSLWELAPSTCNGNLVDTIKFYSAQTAGKEFKLEWLITTSDQNILTPSQDTKHSMYVTHDTPILGDRKSKRVIRRETVFNIGCRNADGMKEDPNAQGGAISKLDIAKAIYGEFTDLEVARVVPTKALLRDEAMTYWLRDGDGIPQAGCNDHLSLLESASGNGTCEAWSFLLSDIYRANGIDTTRIQIIRSLQTERFLMMYNVVGQDPINTGFPGYNFMENVNIFPFDNVVRGRPAQGLHKANPVRDPPKVFESHYILDCEDSLFDPSYGSAPITGPQRLLDFDDTNILGFGKLTPDGQNTLYRLNSTQVFDIAARKVTDN